jgi:hypothetical protein
VRDGIAGDDEVAALVGVAGALLDDLHAVAGDLGVRSHCRFRNRGAKYLNKYGIKWTSGSTK